MSRGGRGREREKRGERERKREKGRGRREREREKGRGGRERREGEGGYVCVFLVYTYSVPYYLPIGELSNILQYWMAQCQHGGVH